MSRPFRLGRRAFLRGGSGIAVALPLLEIMTPARAAPTYPKRFVVFFTANGTVPSAWTPGPDFTFGPILQPLEEHKSDLLVVSGLDMKSAGGDRKGHNRGVGCLLTGVEPLGGNDGDSGYANGISVDQRIAQVAGVDTPFASIELGVQVKFTIPRGRMSYAGPNQPLPPEDNPFAAFDRLFGDLGEDEASLQLAARRQSVLDAVKDDFDRLTPRLGSADRLKLEAHLEAVRGVEKRLASLSDLFPACATPETGEHFDWKRNERFADVGRIQMDLLVMALACGLTNVASLMWSHALSGTVFTWLGHTTDHHTYSHSSDTDSQAKLVEINRWYAERFAELLGAMKAIPEGDGTLLDNAVIMWGSELGKGQPHYCNNIPIVLAGGAQGYFTPGRHVAYDDASHNDLLLSLLEAMDVPDQTFGDPAFCTGPLPELR